MERSVASPAKVIGPVGVVEELQSGCMLMAAGWLLYTHTHAHTGWLDSRAQHLYSIKDIEIKLSCLAVSAGLCCPHTVCVCVCTPVSLAAKLCGLLLMWWLIFLPPPVDGSHHSSRLPSLSLLLTDFPSSSLRCYSDSSFSQAAYCHSCVFPRWASRATRHRPFVRVYTSLCALFACVGSLHACSAHVCSFQDWYGAVPGPFLPTSWLSTCGRQQGPRRWEKHREPLCAGRLSPSFLPRSPSSATIVCRIAVTSPRSPSFKKWNYWNAYPNILLLQSAEGNIFSCSVTIGYVGLSSTAVEVSKLVHLRDWWEDLSVL